MKLLLLHGALGSEAMLQPLANALHGKQETLSFNFNGHGGRPKRSIADFSIAGFGADTLTVLDEQGIDQVNIFGYSMGGYVGLWLARHHPARIGKVFTLATKFEWSPEIAAREIRMLDAETIAAKVPKFAAALEQRHAPLDWKVVLRDTAAMMVDMGANPPLRQADFEAIQHPIRLGLGDRDKMVTLEETRAVQGWLPESSWSVFPATPHPLERVPVDYLANELLYFFNSPK